jgi:isocitrate dehydrogenase
VTADPFEKGLTFSGRAAVVGLETSELYGFIEPATKLQVPEGTIDIFVEFDCRNGELTGGVKPVLKNVKIRPDNKKVFTVLKAWASDLAIKLFSDRVHDRNAVATVIPIKGTLTGPNVELWPSIFGVLRNAFVEGLTSGYAFLPPKMAETPPPGPGRSSPDESHSSSPPAAP